MTVQMCNSTDTQSGETDSATNPDRLIVFAKYPQAGKVKTRLTPALSADQAAQIHTALTRKTLSAARTLCASSPCDLEVQFSGGTASQMQSLFGDTFPYCQQQGQSLGERLENAVSKAFSTGAKRVVVIGTDCPELNADQLKQALAALEQSDVVLGPALDGGYYLIGMRTSHPELFRGIEWGSESVLSQTLQTARQARLTVQQLKPLSDVDYVEDLQVCRKFPESFTGVLPDRRPGWLSIVVPTLNEEKTIQQTLAPLRNREKVEILIADGGSRDATAQIAHDLGIRVIPVRPGRGRQMNAGAALACGEALLFLHADTILPESFQKQVWETFRQEAIAGAFRLKIDHPGKGFRWIEYGANLRSTFLQMPYGDQGLFLKSEVFDRVGGYQNWPLMEDYEMCQRLRRLGQIRLASSAVRTSARRWLKRGLVRTTLINQFCIAGYRLGISPDRLARWYRSRKA